MAKNINTLQDDRPSLLGNGLIPNSNESSDQPENQPGQTFDVCVDGRQCSVVNGLNTCAICYGTTLITTEDKARGSFVDGRFACRECRDSLISSFTSRYYVCINVLCRRKWKQLTPRVVPLFCPSCRKNLELRLKPHPVCMSDVEYLQMLHAYWMKVIHELSLQLFFPWSSEVIPKMSQSFESLLRDTLHVFHESFKEIDVTVENCRNWNSMLVRKKYYRGFVSSKDPVSSVCRIMPECELTHNFEQVAKPLPNKQYHFFFLDWKDELNIGRLVYFIAFPNPVVDKERDFVAHIIKVISGPDKLQTPEVQNLEHIIPEPQKINSPFAPYCSGSSPGPFALRTPSLFTPPSAPWKVQPLWDHPPMDMVINVDGNPKLQDFAASPPPPGLEHEVGSHDIHGPGASSMGLEGFGDLMQWSDSMKEPSSFGKTNEKNWYDPLEAHDKQSAHGHPLKLGRTNPNIHPVPEDREVNQDFEWPVGKKMPEGRRTWVPQSPFAVYFGD